MAANTPKPAWLETLLDDYRNEVANTFVVYGNVYDYAEHPERTLPVREYLGTMLAALFTVAQYAPDEGITFAGPPPVAAEARRRFEQVLGLGQQQAPDPFLGAGAAGTDGAPVALPGAAAQALPLCVEFMRAADKDDGSGKLAAVLVDRLDLICPPADKGMLPDGKAALLALLHRVGTEAGLTQRGALTIMLAPTLEEVHPDLRLASSGIRAIEIPPPDYARRAAFAERILAAKGLASELPIGELAAQTAGLGYRHIEDLALRAEAGGGTITRALVKARKAEMIASEYAEVLEILEPDVTMADVGGHAEVKAYLRDYVVAPMQAAELRAYAPMGLGFWGPPGTGKTYLARALATETGVNCVLLRGDKIKGGIVGESERRIAKALTGIRALAPCLVFMDELDQQSGRRSTGGGDGGSAVEGNQFGRLLEFFGDTAHRGEIMLVAASNRPDLVDDAFKRAGRIDVICPLLPPADAGERDDVLRAIMVRHGVQVGASGPAFNAACTRVAETTDDWTPAELEALVVRAKAIARIKGTAIDEALTEARRRMKSAVSAENRYQARLALAECNDLELVPAKYRQYVGEAVPADEVPAGEEPARARKAGRALEL